MAHKLETAHISFGLVTIPRGIYSAIDEQDIHFHQLHAAKRLGCPGEFINQ
jgi:non-homologous end joining protein Ku